MLKHLFLIIVAAFASAVMAQTYPERQIRIISPFSAGGGPDLVMRMLAEPVGKRLGQPVIIDSRPGANGIVALDAAMRATPDGHTLAVGDNGSLAINPALNKATPYHPQNDFAPITMIYSTPFFLVVNAGVKAQSFAEFAALLRAQPGVYNYGSSGNGSPTHLDFELLKRGAGNLSIAHVPHKGIAPLIQSLLAGDVAASLLGLTPLAGGVKSGKLRILAVAAPTRSSAYPEAPTVAEAGGPADFRSGAWVGLLAPKGTRTELIARLHESFALALSAPEIRARIEQQGFTPLGTGPEAMAQRIAQDLPHYAAAVAAAGARLD